MAMHWHDLLFAHWPVRPDVVRPLIPSALELDTFDGWAWIGVVPFRMSGVRLRYMPRWLGFAFPELNVRTYVKSPDRRGVWFFSLDATSRLAVRVARAWYGLPYFDAQMTVAQEEAQVHYVSRRVHRRAPPAALQATYAPVGAVYEAQPGTLDYWLTERHCLYAVDRKGRVGYGDIHHRPWPLQCAEARLRHNTMIEPLGIHLPDQEPLLHFARHLEVVAWSVRPLGT